MLYKFKCENCQTTLEYNEFEKWIYDIEIIEVNGKKIIKDSNCSYCWFNKGKVIQPYILLEIIPNHKKEKKEMIFKLMYLVDNTLDLSEKLFQLFSNEDQMTFKNKSDKALPLRLRKQSESLKNDFYRFYEQIQKGKIRINNPLKLLIDMKLIQKEEE